MRHASFPVLALALALVGGPVTLVHAAGRARIAKGTNVSVKAVVESKGLRARSVEAADSADESIRGPLQSVDPSAGVLRIANVDVVIGEGDVVDEEDAALDLGALAPGQVVKISFDTGPEGRVVDKVRRRVETGSQIRVEGAIEEVLGSGAGTTTFRVAGVVVSADGDTEFQGIRALPTRLAVDDEDIRPTDAIELGPNARLGWLSGEVRLDMSDERDYDLARTFLDDFARARLRTELEWTLPPRGPFSGMIEVKGQMERILEDELDERESTEDVVLGTTYALFSGVLTPHGSIQVGRSRWDDERDWWFREELDSVRFYFDWEKWGFELAWSEQLVDPLPDLDDAAHAQLRLTFRPHDDHLVHVRALRRFDHDESRDFEPVHVGVHAEGEGKELWHYWLDAAVVRGADEGEDLRGYAVDAGVRLTWDDVPLEPTLVLAYAMGSGDPDPSDDVIEEFRQTGLHANGAKWNGLANFALYGEVLNPELSNLHVRTVGFGLRPHEDVSVDVAYHDYELDEPAIELTDADAGDDRRLDRISTDVGSEIDLIVAYEGLEHWEFELDAGRFSPGTAFLGPEDPAIGLSIKAKFIY